MSRVAVAALILAGGQSSRMGQDKALIAFQGKPLLRSVCDVAITCCGAVYLLTPWPERYTEILPEACMALQELNAGQGPLVALAQGLGEIQADWVLLLACDLPRLDSRILQIWIGQLPQVPKSTLAVVPYQSTRWEPLCGFYRPISQSHLGQFIQQGGKSFQVWLSQIQVQSLAVDSSIAAMLHNCNTPEDLSNYT
ncbi:MAG: molybdenum cofactor guanylyltransferase [Oscillatoriales cyanobacterium RM2_1_1]|nr:molybdenum cofactor guanylyltransferase [Oscillatoriales cyanobacterium SM2_3_0]NJO45566.1 molybdenum cofactor guanylyltransferase [Oscillatoriales cyanobacterium RM2_1_1]